MSPRARNRSKFSIVDLVRDHYLTLRNAATGRMSISDLAYFVAGPAAVAAVPVLLDARAGHVPELLSATAIFTGLIFGVYVLMFDMTMRATDHADPARRGTILKLAAEVRANITYAVLVGLSLTTILGGFVAFAGEDTLPLPVTAVVVFGALQLFLTIFMVLKRVRALYLGYITTQPDRVP